MPVCAHSQVSCGSTCTSGATCMHLHADHVAVHVCACMWSVRVGIYAWAFVGSRRVRVLISCFNLSWPLYREANGILCCVCLSVCLSVCVCACVCVPVCCFVGISWVRRPCSQEKAKAKELK